MYFNNLVKALVVSAIALVLNACQNSNIDYNRYFLVSNVRASSFVEQNNIKLKLNDVLANGGIVIQMSDVALYTATNHRWADRLDLQLKALWVDRFVCDKYKNLDFNIYVSEFNGSQDGYAKVALAVWVYDKKHNVVFNHDYHHSQALEQDGYDALVSALKNSYLLIIDKFNSDFSERCK